MPPGLRATWRLLISGRGRVRERAWLIGLVVFAVITIELWTRLLVLYTWPPGTWIELLGPFAIGRNDHRSTFDLLNFAARYVLGMPALLFLMISMGHLPVMRTWMTLAVGLVVGGSLANFISLALSGYVANWLAIGSFNNAMAYVPADVAQIAGLSMMVGGAVALIVFGISERLVARLDVAQ